MHRRDFLTALGFAATSAVAGGTAWASQGKGRRLRLIHLTDTHAQLEAHMEYLPDHPPAFGTMGGFARLRRAADALRSTAPGPSFLVDGGDLVQGSGPAAWSRGEVMIAPANGLGLDAFVPGNWEPVYGPDRFMELMGALKTKVLAYNFHRKANGERLFEPATVITRDGVRIAFVGIADPTTTIRQPPRQVEGLDSTRMDGLREYFQDLRRKERPDLVVAVTHTGLTVSRQLARENPELDVVLSGHTHERTFRAIREGNCLIVEAGSHGSFLGCLDIALKDGGGIEGHDFRLVPIDAAEFGEDAAVGAIVDRELAPYRERMNRVLCKTRVPILRYDVLETNADNLITDAVRQATGADIGLSNGFRFGPPIPSGPLTEAQWWTLLPIDARVKQGWVSGAELRAYLEGELELVFSKDPWKLSGGWGPRASGLDITFEAYAAPGRRVREILVNGTPIKDMERYSIAGCEREGEPMDVVCRHRGTHDVQVVGSSIQKLMHDYFAAHPVIEPKVSGRSRAVDLPAHIFSQDGILTRGA